MPKSTTTTCTRRFTSCITSSTPYVGPRAAEKDLDEDEDHEEPEAPVEYDDDDDADGDNGNVSDLDSKYDE
jgi:hypothetical protein